MNVIKRDIIKNKRTKEVAHLEIININSNLSPGKVASPGANFKQQPLT